MISDLIMPDLGGIVRAGQARRKYPGLPVLFISGYNVSAVVRLEMGGVGAAFLQRPFSPHELTEKVREVLNLERGEKAHSVNR